MDENLRIQTPTNETAPGAAPAGPPDLQQEAARTRALLAASADLVASALSSDSEAFLRASRQHGGE
jgi:hypothetical protein